ncbi:MAG: hypothetical protein FWE68_02925 [Defluviitaleaceae bacterium]|nr:hypothetical protein [Defluviitaleaceae bacterium]
METVKHVTIRLYLSLLLVLFFITGGLALIILAPVYKSAFAPLASYRDFKFSRVWAHIYKVMWRSLSDKSYRDMYPSKLTDPPRPNNSHSPVRIKESWRGADDNCDMCQNSCCAQITCPMLKDRRCLSYGSLYFGYYFCGRHPENQSQMDLYQCPKWEMRPEGGALS